MRVKAVRGAITVNCDSREEIVDATSQLLREMITRNGVEIDDTVFILFTATEDLRGEFPAVAARKLGLDRVPVICARELDIKGSLPMTVRVMMLVYTEKGLTELQHVYLRNATVLRTDLSE
ncbi:MAG: chorismate mutase [Actinobacteria bacterium]|nr:chorismate mutase [Actinomycetota bacterium]